jgi:predicted PurR-regulated permease PerM
MAMPILIIPFLTYMFFTGYTFLAFLGLIDLLIVWFLFENIIKPQVISKTVKINTFIILISMIGGIQTLGFVGLFLGPAIVSMAIGMIKTFLLLPTTKEEIKNT